MKIVCVPPHAALLLAFSCQIAFLGGINAVSFCRNLRFCESNYIFKLKIGFLSCQKYNFFPKSAPQQCFFKKMNKIDPHWNQISMGVMKLSFFSKMNISGSFCKFTKKAYFQTFCYFLEFRGSLGINSTYISMKFLLIFVA